MISGFLQCEFCSRNDSCSECGLKQHQNQNKACFKKSQEKFADMSGYQTAHEYMDFEPIVRTFGRTDTAFIAQQTALATLPCNAFLPTSFPIKFLVAN